MSIAGRLGWDGRVIRLAVVAVVGIGCGQQPEARPANLVGSQGAQPPVFPHLTAFVRDTAHPRALDDVVLHELAQALEADSQLRAANLPATDTARVKLLQDALGRVDARFDGRLVPLLRDRRFPITMSMAASIWQATMVLSLPGWQSNDYQALVAWTGSGLEYQATLSIRTPLALVDTLSEAYFQSLTSYVNLAYVVSDLSSPTGYAPLGIPSTDAACLYANPTQAFFTAAPCSETLAAPPAGVTMLKVNRVTYASIPPVARWEWSNRRRVNTVGVKCGGAWCEVVPTSFLGGDPERDDPQDGEGAKPEFATKPWYDFQLLGDGAPIRPGRLQGRIRPAPGITQLNDAANPAQDKFLEVAVVWLYGPPPESSKYARMGLRAGRNVVSICHGSFDACRADAGNPAGFPNCGATDAYFSRIGTTYACPIYTFEGAGHPFITTTRWAWDPADEGMWIRCPEGCCQIKGS